MYSACHQAYLVQFAVTTGNGALGIHKIHNQRFEHNLNWLSEEWK